MLSAFYQQYNPAKVAEVDKLLAKYRGNEEQMFRNLAKKYNLDPSIFGLSAAAPAGGTFGSPSIEGTPGFGQPSVLGGVSAFGGSGASPFGGSTSSGGGGGFGQFASSPAPGQGFGSTAGGSFGGVSSFGSLAQSPSAAGGFGAFSSPAPAPFGTSTPFGAPRR